MSGVGHRRLTTAQLEALRAIPEGNRHTLECGHYRVPVENYLDPEIFEREREAIFEKGPMLAGPSALLPEKNSFRRFDLLGKAVLLTRAEDGIARAFLNVCQHRGTILCPEHERGSGKRIVCPYHAWTYGLDGQLVGVPRKEIFEGLDVTAHGLVPLPCNESGGLIWIGLRRDFQTDFSEVSGDLAEEFSALGLEHASIFDQKHYRVRANWKLVMDTMLDSYHVIRLHRNTLAKYFVDTPTGVEMIGPHIRSTSGRKDFAQADLADDVAAVRRVAVFSYAAFPTGIAVLSPDYISLAVLLPVSADETVIDYYMMIDAPPATEKARGKLQRSFELMDRAFGDEDFWIAERNQEGLSTGALTHLTLGGMERQMRLFHDVVDARLADSLAQTGA